MADFGESDKIIKISQKVDKSNTYILFSSNISFFIRGSKSKVGDHSRGWPEGSLFDSYYTMVYGRVLLLSLDCSTLPLFRTL